MHTNEEQVTQLLEALKGAAQQVRAEEAKAIKEGLVADASKAWDGFIQSYAEKAVAQQVLSADEKKALKIEIVSEGGKGWDAFKQLLLDNKIGTPEEIEKMDRLKKVFENWKSENPENLASALQEMNVLLNEGNLIKNIETSRAAGKEESARKAENRLEQLRAPADVMVAQRWESKMQAIKDFEENPLRKLLKNVDTDIMNGVLERLNSEPNPHDNQERYVDAVIRDGVQGALTEKLEVKASLLTDRDYYRREEGFDESVYGTMKTGLMLKNKDDEISAGRNATQQATEKLTGLSDVLEVKDNTTIEDISRGRFFRASVALYNSIPLPQATGANVSGKSTPGEVYRLYEACQSTAARTILSSWETMPTFSDFYQDQKPRAVSSEVKEAVVNHVIQKNKLTEIPVPNRYEVMQSAQKGSEDKKEAVYRSNSVEVMRSFSEILLENITDMRNEHPTECVQLLNQLGKAYEKVTASEDFYASPEIKNAINQLVRLKPSLLEDARFAGALLQFNQVAEYHSQEPVNLGEQNNLNLQERTKTFDPFLNTVTFKNMGDEVGKKFSMAVDKETAAKGATQGQKFFRWLNSPTVLLQLKDPLNIAVGDRVPSTIEFKDGSRIRVTPTGNLKLEGFSLERLRSFSDAMGVRSIGNDLIRTSAESDVFHQQFMREIGHSEIPYSHPSQLERMRSATSTRTMQNLQRSPEMAESRRERRLAKKLSKESIEESFESEKRKSSEISGETVTGAPRKLTRFGRKPSNESLTSEAKETHVGVVMGRKGQVSPRDSDSDSVDSSLSPREESSVSPRSDSKETFSNKKSEEVRFSRGGTISEEKSEEEQFDEFIEPMELKERVEQYRGVVRGLEISSGDRDPTLKDQLNHELAQISSELTAHSEGGIIDQGLLEETEQKLSRLQQKLNTLVKGEERLQEILKQGVKVDVGFERTRYGVKQAQDAVQTAINDIREINLKFEESRHESEVTSVKTEVAAPQSGIKEDAKLVSSGEMIDEGHLSEIAEVTDTAEEKQGPLMKVRRILADVMSSTAGVMLVKSIGDFIQTRRDQRRDAMSTKPDDEKFPKKGLEELADMPPEPEDIMFDTTDDSEDFAQNEAQAIDLQAGADPEESGESYWFPATGEYEGLEGDKGKSEEQKAKPLFEESMADVTSEDDMETVSLLDKDQSQRASRVSGAESAKRGIESDEAKASSRDGRAESVSSSEKGATTREATGLAGLWQSVKKAWADISFRFGPASARAEVAKGVDTSAVRSASAGGVAKREFNEVRLVGFAGDLSKPKMIEKLKEWHKAFEGQLKIERGSFENPPIKFAGKRSIEVKDNEVVMKGFSVDMYREFRKTILSDNTNYKISAANNDSYVEVNKAMGGKGERKSIMSRLASIGLFFQKLWADAKDFVFGTVSTPEIKSLGDKARTSSASSTGQDTTFPADLSRTSTASVSSPEAKMDADSTIGQLRDSQQVGEANTVRPIAGAQHPTLERQVTLENVNNELGKLESLIYGEEEKAPTPPRRMRVADTTGDPVKSGEISGRSSDSPAVKAMPGQSWVSVKVIVKHEFAVDQKPDIKLLESSLTRAAEEKKLTIVPISNSDHGFQVTLKDPHDPKNGQIKFEASHTEQEVIITMTETKHSDSTVENMASIYTALPPEVQSNPPEVNGPEGRKTEFNQRVESIAKAKGPDNSEPPSLGGGSS